ncbi:hypothetical protein FQ377_14275 [Arthrobacter echini]|uniref:Uncharacterized protein n=1 Tax=Arthrobacter echini TaxID=1529066 RepID=A0A5D0XIB7_9MICC|nr:hypothetical protein [Arthrobacter echini]TYC96197.1 hypothetical protein FQ377_14275 [Arthrobacter echini]
MAGFKFSGNFEREVNRAVQGGVKKVAAEYQRMFDGMLRTYKGRPVSTIKPILRRNWQKIGGDITDPELTTYAQHISDGTKMQMKM